MQNRESAVRNRQKKKESSKNIESENEFLKMENYRLLHENQSLKHEKSFLIEQIKFMQNLIKSNDVKLRSCRDENRDIEKNISNSPRLSSDLNYSPPTSSVNLNGAKQKPFGKLFSVFLICVLSVAYVTFDQGNDLGSNGEKIVFTGGSTMSLNDASERQVVNISQNSYFYGYLYKMIVIFIGSVIIWNFSRLFSYAKSYFNRKRDKLY
jgi:hypothetical protein